MSWALISTILAYIVKYGPEFISILTTGVKVEQQITQLDPQFWSTIQTEFANMFPNVNLSVILQQFEKPSSVVLGIPGYGSDGGVTSITNPDA